MPSSPPHADFLRIAYFGLPLGALCLARAGFAPSVISLGHDDAVGARRVRRVLSKRALVLSRPDLSHPSVVRAIESAHPDVIVSWFWPRLIPACVLELAPRGAFGAHPSLLPAYRGPDPYFWSILRGEVETGVTLHRLASAYDTGAVIAQRRVAIEPDDDAWSLAKKLDRPGLALIVECLERLSAGERLEGEPQDERRASLAPRPSDDDLVIRWEHGVDEIVRRVRACGPHPGARFEVDGQELSLLRARPFQGTLPAALAPADAVQTDEGVAIVAGDGAVLLERVRDEQDEVHDGADIAALFAATLTRLPR
jgi:methionyl-tRNA formyltransferase